MCLQGMRNAVAEYKAGNSEVLKQFTVNASYYTELMNEHIYLILLQQNTLNRRLIPGTTKIVPGIFSRGTLLLSTYKAGR